jgi:hypothetical protein
MPVYQYEGNHYDLPDGLSNEQAISKIKAHLGPNDNLIDEGRDWLIQRGKDALGTAAGLVDVAAGIPKAAVATMATPMARLSGRGKEFNADELRNAAGAAMEDLVPSIGGIGTIAQNPGYRAAHGLASLPGEGINWLGDKVGELTGSKEAAGISKLGLDVASFGMAIPGTRLAAKGLGKFAEKVDPALRNAGKKPAADISGLMSEMTKPIEEVNPQAEFFKQQAHAKELQAQIDRIKQGQKPITVDSNGTASTLGATGELIARSPMENMARELGANDRPAQEITPTSRMANDLVSHSTAEQRAAMDAADLATQQKAGADALWLEHSDRIVKERQTELELAVKRQAALDNNAAERTRQEAASATSEAHRNLAETRTKITELNKYIAEAQQRFGDTEKMRQASQPEMFEGLDNGYGPNPHDIGGQQHWTVDENGMPIRADLSMEAVNLENPLQRNMWGDELGQKHEQEAARGITQAMDATPDTPFKGDLRDQQAALLGDNTAKARIPFNFRKQGGGLLIGPSKAKQQGVLKQLPGVKERIGDLLPDRRPTEQFLKEETNSPDIDQNAAQRLSNYFTKGSTYQAIKTQNPVIKRVSERILDAVKTSKGAIASLVHDGLAPAARNLSKQEKADVWAAQVLAEQTKRPLTREMLEKHGFNERQIKWVETHTKVMAEMLPRVNEASKLSGEGAVRPQMAYLASRAAGDFRRLVYKEVTKPDGSVEKTPVSILGANTRWKLNADIKKLQDAHPEWIVGEERYFGGGGKRGGTADGFSQMLELIGKNNPDVKLLAEHVNELLTKDAYNYMNAKTHTMEKKGIAGMQGRKEFADAVTNAEEGMKAQIQYAEKIIEWSEMTKAIADLKPILVGDNGLNMPKAKEWSEQYIQQALGNNPSSVGRAIDNVFAEIGKKTGVGTTSLAKGPNIAKRFVNGLLLGFSNVGFLGANFIQPFKSMPEMMSFLKGRGLDKKFDAGTGYRYLANAIDTAYKDVAGLPVEPWQRDALKYAKEKHVYSSELFDSNNNTSKNAGYYWDKGTQFIASPIEMRTRQIAFLSYVDILHENGITAKDGLYEAASNLTDIQMNNYSQSEAPKAYAIAGGMGRSAYNLMSFKHNEYSRLAMLANEMGRSKTATPLLVNIMSSVAFAGVMGTIAYTEADAIVKLISKKLGEPTSLTKVLLDNPSIPDSFKYGMGSTAGVDLTNRLGTGPLVPEHAIDAVMPGAGKLVNIGKAGYDLAISPNEYNAKNFGRELAPNAVNGVLDRSWFSPKNNKGEEMSLNRNKVQAGVVRNEADKLWKTVGMTGLNEAKEKSKIYENSLIDRVYTEKRALIIKNAAKEMYTSGVVPKDFAVKYLKAQGNPTSIGTEIQQMQLEQGIDARTLSIMKNAMSNSVTSTHKLLRAVGAE